MMVSTNSLTSSQGSPNVLMVLQLIEEKPNITTLPLPQRRAMREEWAREAWAHFFGYGRLSHEFGVRSDCPFLYSSGK